MPRFTRKEIPEGFALREFPGGRFQGYRLNSPNEESLVYTRRLAAVNWCWLRVAEKAAQRTVVKYEDWRYQGD